MPRRSIPDLVNTFHLSVFLFFLLQFVNCKQQLIDGKLFVLRIFRKFSDQFFVRSSSVFQRFPRPLPPDAADIPQAEDKEQNQNEKDKRHRQKNRICLPDTGKKGCTGRGKMAEPGSGSRLESVKSGSGFSGKRMKCTADRPSCSCKKCAGFLDGCRAGMHSAFPERCEMGSHR